MSINLYSSIWDLGSLGSRKVLVVNAKPDKVTNEAKQYHHLMVIDTSGSMSGNMNELKDNLKFVISHIPDEDYVSMIQFSSEGCHKVLFKGAKKEDKSLNSIVDNMQSSGCTCFSKPMEEAGTIVKDLTSICPNFSITLFTDGEPVTSRSSEDEINLTINNIRKYADEVVSINTIGYGNYYNKDFLIQISALSGLGVFTHSSKIAEYSAIFEDNYEAISGLVRFPIKIRSDGHEIMYTNSKLTVSHNTEISLSTMDKTKNQFVIIGSDTNDFKFSIDDINYSTAQLDSILDSSKVSILYSYIYTQYYKGNRGIATKVLRDILKDKPLIDLQMKSFTNDEVATCTEAFRKASRYSTTSSKDPSKKIYRHPDSAGDNYLPKDDAACLMDILKILINKGDNYYIYQDNYKRIGKTIIDSKDKFIADKSNEILTPIEGLTFNETRLNISLKSEIPGTVNVGPNTHGLPENIKTVIHRNQTVVKDGQYNMDSVTFKISDEANNEITNLINSNHELNNNIFINGDHLLLNLIGLPIINYSYVNDGKDPSKVLKIINRVTKNLASQKVLNNLKGGSSNSLGFFKSKAVYTPEQIQFLKDNGLDSELRYCGIDNVEVETGDSYITRELDYYIKGISSLPSIDKVLEKMNNKKSLTKSEGILYEEYTRFNGCTLDMIKRNLNLVKRELLEDRAQLSAQKIALVLTGEWFGELPKDEKGNYLYTEGEDTLVIKSTKLEIKL
jgi:hypothetical protein